MKRILPTTAVMSLLWVSARAAATHQAVMPGSGARGAEDYKFTAKGQREMKLRPVPDLYKAREHYAKNLGPGKTVEFPQWATDKFMQGLNEGIRSIESATDTPAGLKSLRP